MKYIAELDSLRAVAVLLVIAFHAGIPHVNSGYLGVDIFFVLSGFLITSLLLEEREKSGRVDIPQFYLRRAKRLLPAMAILCAGYALFAPALFPALPAVEHYKQAAAAMLFVSDYTLALMGLFPLNFAHVWSLAVEVHYYMIWPFLLLFIMARFPGRKMVPVLAALYVAATLWRVFCITGWQEWDQVYHRFDARLSGLLAGSLLAAYARYIGTVPHARALFGYLAVISACYIVAVRWHDDLSLVVGATLVEALAFCCIAGVIRPEKWLVRDVMGTRLLREVGKMSYGLYLYHYPVFLYFKESDKSYGWTSAGIGFALTFAIAAASYYGVERPILARKKQRYIEGI